MAQETGNGLAVWEYPKRSRIWIRPLFKQTPSGAVSASYRVEVPAKITGKGRQLKQFKRREDAEAWADSVWRGQRLDGKSFFELTDVERREVATIVPLLRERGISLTEAAQFVLERMRPRELRKPVAEVVRELVASKEQRFKRGDLREASYRDFNYRTRAFVAAMGERLADEVTCADIKAWLKGLGREPRTNTNYLAVVGEVFRYAVQKKYVLSSPLDELTDVERKELCGVGDAKEPSILTVDEAERLLNAAWASLELDLLGAVVLGLFCGLRTEEIKRLEWDSVRMGEAQPVVVVGAKIAKKRRIRHVDIPPVALAWLSLVPNRTGEVTRNEHINDYQKRFRGLHKLAGFAKWETNAMRHSFGSYHYALHGNPLETSRLLGHKASDEVLFSHYRALVTKEQAERYFAISPPKTEGNILSFRAA